jgi:hypothetical protein
MPIGMVFWMLMILWFIFWGWTNWGGGSASQFGWAPNLLLFVLLFLLGWKDFGFVVH